VEKNAARFEEGSRSIGGAILTYVFGLLLFPFTICVSWIVVGVNEEVVVQYWGRYYTTIKEPGIYFYTCFGRTTTNVSIKQQTIDLAKAKVADANGSPIIIDGVITFKIINSAKSVLAVANGYQFTLAQSQIVLRQVASRYRYAELKQDSIHVAEEMKKLVQQRIAVAGIHVLAMDLTDLSYSTEMAQALLLKQQSEALLEARKIIVEGAVEITVDAIQELQKKGIPMSDAEKTRLVSNLLIVVVGNEGAKPMINVS